MISDLQSINKRKSILTSEIPICDDDNIFTSLFNLDFSCIVHDLENETLRFERKVTLNSFHAKY